MSNAIVTVEEFEVMTRTATAMVKSGYFKDAREVAQAFVKIQAGAEIGLAPFASMTGIHIIQGKPALSSNVVATLVANDPRYSYRVKEASNTTCAIDWYENGDRVGRSSFSMDEAQAAGLNGKATWKAYPSDMLFARAITRGARRFAPGIFGGSPIYTPDELGADVDEEGNVIEGEIITDTPSDNGQQDAAETVADTVAEDVDEALDTEQGADIPAEYLDLLASLDELVDPNGGTVVHKVVGIIYKTGLYGNGNGDDDEPGARKHIYNTLNGPDFADLRDKGLPTGPNSKWKPETARRVFIRCVRRKFDKVTE
jgi:hypothetical protein